MTGPPMMSIAASKADQSDHIFTSPPHALPPWEWSDDLTGLGIGANVEHDVHDPFFDYSNLIDASTSVSDLIEAPAIGSAQGPNGTAPSLARKRNYTRQRRGCKTCRQRKKKCNQSYPICGHCSRLNLECVWEDPRAVPSSNGITSSSATADTTTVAATDSSRKRADISAGNGLQVLDLRTLADPFDLLPSSSLAPGAASSTAELVSSRRAMMRYYTQSFALMLTTNVENNCFLSVLLPMAFECPALTYSLAAFSSTHLALRSDHYRSLSLHHRGQAMAELNTVMKHESITQEMCLAVVMVLCSMESISDATNNWVHHLAGAAAILRAQGVEDRALRPSDSFLGTHEGRWLLRNFAYHDILASVSLDRRPLLSGDYWLSQDQGSEAVADTYFGFAAQILYQIGEVSSLNADWTDVSDSESTEEISTSLEARAENIESKLRDWSCPSDISTSQEALVLLGEAYRQAALIHLYRALRRHRTRPCRLDLSVKVAQCVAAIRDIAASMPQGSLAGCTMLFPLFLAGGEAEDQADIEVIRESLLTMNQSRRFRNFDECLNVLDVVWRLKCAGTRKDDADKVDWIDIVKARGWKLSIS